MEKIKGQEELRDLFWSVVDSRNFVTPDIECYYEAGRYVCELSSGYGVGTFVYGVTVVDVEKGEKCPELCTSFIGERRDEARRQAVDYINSLG